MRNQCRLQVHGAGNLELAAHGGAQGLDREFVGQAEQDDGGRILRHRQHLEGHLAQDRKRAPAARQAAAQVDAGDVLHHAAAGLEDLASAVDGAHAQDVVAGRAGADPPRAGHVGGEYAADRALAGLAADERPELDVARTPASGRGRRDRTRSGSAACRRGPT